MSIIVGQPAAAVPHVRRRRTSTGALGAVPYLLIIMPPLFMNKVWNSIFVN